MKVWATALSAIIVNQENLSGKVLIFHLSECEGLTSFLSDCILNYRTYMKGSEVGSLTANLITLDKTTELIKTAGDQGNERDVGLITNNYLFQRLFSVPTRQY